MNSNFNVSDAWLLDLVGFGTRYFVSVGQ